MEIKATGKILFRPVVFIGLLLFCASPVKSQSFYYGIKQGKMMIEVDKKISISELRHFIETYNLRDIGMQELVLKNKSDSLVKNGWKVSTVKNRFRLEKQIFSVDEIMNDIGKVSVNIAAPNAEKLKISNDNNFGFNRFKSKTDFTVKENMVEFFLEGNEQAKEVWLTGNFTNWQLHPIKMLPSEKGWKAEVKLPSGKYLYKFIVDGLWTFDPDNKLKENDGMGNINSVYYKPNVVFKLSGFQNAKKVFLAGSFNEWNDKAAPMYRTGFGWQLAAYLPKGTHTYRFIVDGEWMPDPGNKKSFPNEFGSYNSVIQIGKPYVFYLPGYSGANKVFITGSFNGWKKDELSMHRYKTGWELEYVLGPGNYEYKFIVDGKYVGENTGLGKQENYLLTIQPNHVFSLKGFKNARMVTVSGDFNNWNDKGYMMKQTEGVWKIELYLKPGKNRYKFIVDGKWILDPDNKLWEQNEYGTGNSIIWID